jgi:chemotaxis response regulator CheB
MAITVLVVDDHETMRKAIVRLLVGDAEIEVVAELTKEFLLHDHET